MSSWMNDAAAVQNHNGAAFNHLNDQNMGSNMIDPSAFMNAPNNNFINPAQFQNPSMQGMQNGSMRNPSPGFNSPVYQTNPIIPSKRPRPREDSLSVQSPRQAPGMLPASRSQTPQQNFPTFTGAPSQHAPQPTHFSHLQHNGSANATPSPVMGNQLRPSGAPQRVATASPHPFSPAVQQFAPSPSHSDHASRTDTPQGQFMQNTFAPGFNQPFTPPQGRSGPSPQPGTMTTPQMPMQQQPMQPPQMFQQGQPQAQPNPQDQAKMMYQMQLQQQMNQRGMMNPRMGNMPQNPNAMKPGMSPMNGQYMQGMRPQQPPMARPNNPEQFMKSLTTFMQSRGMALDPNPMVGGKPVNFVMLYMMVTRFGGYRKVTQSNMWVQVANGLSLNTMQNPNAPQQVKELYERNLMLFEDAWSSEQRKRQMSQSGTGMGPVAGQMSPTKQMMPGMPGMMGQPQQFINQPPRQQPQMAQQSPQMPMPQQIPNTPVKQMSQPPPHAGMNGFATPQMGNSMLPNAQTHARNSVSRDMGPIPNGGGFPAPSPAMSHKAPSISMPLVQGEPPASIVEVKQKSSTYVPQTMTPTTWGGVDPDALEGVCIDLVNLRPNVPNVMELGLIDIHALMMGLQSGMHAEVRLALDTLATVSVEPRSAIDLRACGDLVDSIIDCAETQIELLAENAPEVSDELLIHSYEDVVRGCKIEREGLQEIPQFGTIEYELDRAAERLICITTILRNLSFYETNHPDLAEKSVTTFLSLVIRHLGTRNMLLRTWSNTLDLMKDLVIFFSNLAQTIEIPGKEQALCLLHFLLAFAPCPPPVSSESDAVAFSPYDPLIHKYVPPAVDSLAKLLARDEPNRTYYRKIFAADGSSPVPYELLTRVFGLAICPIPGHKHELTRPVLLKTVDGRKPHLMQGMLAADILASLAPGHESGVTRSWLTSDDGFARSLLRLITVLSTETNNAAAGRGVPNPNKLAEDEAMLHITLSSISTLRRLYQKAMDPEDPSAEPPIDGMISQENLLGALMLKGNNQPRPEVIRQLCAYAELDM